jgi:hypothetical protein
MGCDPEVLIARRIVGPDGLNKQVEIDFWIARRVRE